MDLKTQGAEAVDWAFIYISRGLPWPGPNLPSWTEHSEWLVCLGCCPERHLTAWLHWKGHSSNTVTPLISMVSPVVLQVGTTWRLSKRHTFYKLKFCYICSPDRVSWKKFLQFYCFESLDTGELLIVLALLMSSLLLFFTFLLPPLPSFFPLLPLKSSKMNK